MPGPLDDTLKHLTELSPADWVVQGGWLAAPTTLIDADIATITGATDKVIRVAGSRPTGCWPSIFTRVMTRSDSRRRCCCIVQRWASATSCGCAAWP